MAIASLKAAPLCLDRRIYLRRVRRFSSVAMSTAPSAYSGSGIIALGFIALDLVGGWEAFKSGLASLAQQTDMVYSTRPEWFNCREGGTLFSTALAVRGRG